MPIDVEGLKIQYSAVIDAYSKKSIILLEAKAINAWTAEDCKNWAKCLKECHPTEAHDQNFYPEMLAVIKRANELASDFEPRITQLLSSLLLLDTKDQGRLAEIATGEGKTTTIAMFAVIKALQGNKVDIVTSSPVLADFAVKEKQKFYELFNLSVACNWDEKSTQLESGFKTCYAADIVYGDASNFQWDALRQEYEQDGTRGSRQYNTVIVDEVDSLLIDDVANSAQLAGLKPGFELLEPLLVACWQELTRINQGFTNIDGKIYWQADPESDRHPIPNQQEFLISALTDYLNTLITKPDSPIFIPKHLKTFAMAQTKTWAQSAVGALYEYALGKHYTIADNDHAKNVIAPIDYLNTGVVHANSNWADGLHQFLQIKHGLKISVETLVACYISNMAYFKRYGKQIYGLTGTLGATAEQELLAETYGLDFIKIPSYTVSSFQEREGVIANDEALWRAAITSSTLAETRAGRGVLIICDSINAVKQIHDSLVASGIEPDKIKRFTKADECRAVEQEIKPGEVIIATNLAGRGTDIKTTPEVDANGGLHVCVSFLPRNLRVQRQAFGRTARQGKPGTAQLIVNKTDAGITTDSITSMDELKRQRDLREAARLNQVKEYEVNKIAIKDELFTKFCALSQQLGSKKAIKDRYILKQIEELWSIWLHNLMREVNHSQVIDREQIMASFAEFEAKARKIFATDDINNPCYLVCTGNDLCFDKKFKPAIEKYSRAIELEPQLAVHGYYNRARALIAAKESNYKQKAIADLEEARRIISEVLIPQIQAIPVLASFVPGSNPNVSNDLTKQADAKIALFKKQLEHIDQATYVLANSTRDIIVKDDHIRLTTAFDQSDDTHDSEIIELNAAGLESFYQIEEVPPPETSSSLFGAICCAFLGLCQIVVGALCYATGNVFLGQVLIKEGVNDIMFAVRAAIDGDFSWEKYKEHKVISIAITIATTGIDCIKAKAEAARETASAGQQGVSEIGQKGNLAQIRQENLARARELMTTKQLVTTTLVQRGAQEVASFVADKAISAIIKPFKGEIKKSIREKLLHDLNTSEVKNAVNKLIATHRHMAVQKIAFELISPKRDNFSRAITVFKSIMSHLKPWVAVAVRLENIREALFEIKRLTSEFSREFADKVIALANSLPDPVRSAEPQQLDASRNGLYSQIIDAVTQCVVGQLHSGVVRPVVDQVTQDRVQKIAEDLHSKWFLQPPKPVYGTPYGMQALGIAAGDEIDEKEKDKKAQSDEVTAIISAKQHSVEFAPSGYGLELVAHNPKLHFIYRSASQDYTITKLTKNPAWRPRYTTPNWEQTVAVIASLAKGTWSGITTVLADFLDPIKRISFPTTLLACDATIIAANTFPSHVVLADPFVQDMLMMSCMIQNPRSYQGAHERMSARGEALIATGRQFKYGSVEQRAELLSELLAEILFLRQPEPHRRDRFYPSITAQGESKPKAESVESRDVCFFYNKMALGGPSGPHEKLSLQQIRGKEIGHFPMSGRLIYVVTEDNQLIISGRLSLREFVFHPWLVDGRPVRAAGEVEIANGTIVRINDCSGHYKPSCVDLRSLVEQAFIDVGFTEARGKFEIKCGARKAFAP